MIIFVEKLDFFTLIVSLILKVFFIEVRYVNMIDKFKNGRFIIGLENMGIKWINYTHFPKDIGYKEWAMRKKIAEDICAKIALNSKLYKYIVNEFKMNSAIHLKLDCVLMNILYYKLQDLIKSILFIEVSRHKEGIKRAYLLPAGRYYTFLLPIIYSKKIKIPYFYRIFAFAYYNFTKPIAKFTVVTYFKLRKLIKGQKNKYIKHALEQCKEGADYRIEEVETIYFPHVDISYGTFYVKNYYYSGDVENPLYPSKILHLFFNEVSILSKRYFRLYHIPYEENINRLFDISLSAGFKHFIFKNYKYVLEDMLFFLNCDLVFELIKMYVEIKRYSLFFKKFKHLKICLIGYDQLFPREINVALGLNNIKSIACQERSSGFMNYGFMNHDYYFVWGMKMREFSERYGRNKIQNYIVSGIPRSDLLYRYTVKPVNLTKYSEIKKYKFLILALDCHSAEDFIEDGFRDFAGNWKSIADFFQTLIQLAKDFPEAHFIIKGKSPKSHYRNRLLKESLNQILSLPNIEIEYDINKYNPYKIVPHVDLIIAIYTSLAEEALIAGKKVFFYDNAELLSYHYFYPYAEYGIVAKSYTEIYYKVRNIIRLSQYVSDDRLTKMKTEAFANIFDGNVRKRIQEKIVEIMNCNKQYISLSEERKCCKMTP